jgi:hypothetical protein
MVVLVSQWVLAFSVKYRKIAGMNASRPHEHVAFRKQYLSQTSSRFLAVPAVISRQVHPNGASSYLHGHCRQKEECSQEGHHVRHVALMWPLM